MQGKGQQIAGIMGAYEPAKIPGNAAIKNEPRRYKNKETGAFCADLPCETFGYFVSFAAIGHAPVWRLRRAVKPRTHHIIFQFSGVILKARANQAQSAEGLFNRPSGQDVAALVFRQEIFCNQNIQARLNKRRITIDRLFVHFQHDTQLDNIRIFAVPHD